MTYSQLVTPDPDITCRPGWCLEYVQNTFGAPAIQPSATAAWFGSGTQHTGRDFPPGCWVPVWYSLAGEPLGHVVLLAPDGSVYSTSDYRTTPHHHPSLADLEAYYRYYGMDLTYRGWTEDIEGLTVVGQDGIAAQASTITEMSTEMTPTESLMLRQVWEVLFNGSNETPRPLTVYDRVVDIQMALTAALPQLLNRPDVSPASLAAAIPSGIAQQVLDALAARIATPAPAVAAPVHP